jgi:hypothetical protein
MSGRTAGTLVWNSTRKGITREVREVVENGKTTFTASISGIGIKQNRDSVGHRTQAAAQQWCVNATLAR